MNKSKLTSIVASFIIDILELCREDLCLISSLTALTIDVLSMQSINETLFFIFPYIRWYCTCGPNPGSSGFFSGMSFFALVFAAVARSSYTPDSPAILQAFYR
jgi:hypothetical protein